MFLFATTHSQCPHCPNSSRTFTDHGLKVHIGRLHKTRPPIVFTPTLTVQPQQRQQALSGNNSSLNLDDLATLKQSVRVLRHIPKGARNLAAGKLCEAIDQCIKNNGTLEWFTLLSFAYSALKAPESTSAGNLTTKVKRNICSEGIDSLFVQAETAALRPPSILRTIESKVYEGDLRGAVRILMSDDGIAPPNPETLATLVSKHPAPSRQLTFPPEPDKSCPALSVKPEEVSQALGSFNNSSAAGLDGIRPSHLKELTSGSAGENGPRLLEYLTKLCNFLLSGQLNPEVSPYIYGASLCALSKKDGGLRPIAIGSVFRRLTAKLGCHAVRDEMSSYLQPCQLGFGTKLGCEAAIHATRAFVLDPKNADCVIIKIDLKNAFNSLERDVLLSEVRDKIPLLYPFLHQVYSSPSKLFFNESLIQSQVGAQQGDPLGPLIFSLAIQKVISGPQSPLNVWYLDDGTLGGKPEEVHQDLLTLLPLLRNLGLEVNTNKCEFFPCSANSHASLSSFRNLLPGLKELSSQNFNLLGSPIFPDAVPEAFKTREQLLLSARERLSNLSAHVGLTLLRSCFAVPRITYFLRTVPTWLHPTHMDSFDLALKESTECLLNVSLNSDQWDQASLPIRNGGLGIRRSRDVSLPAFLASAAGVVDLVTKILPLDGAKVTIPYAADALSAWKAFNSDPPVPEKPCRQRLWDDVVVRRLFDTLINAASGADRARLIAASKPESGAWLHALPSPNLGTLLDNDSMRVAAALRLGSDVCQPHQCICGSNVESNGHHALSCCRCAGRFPRHHALNDIIRRALISANVPCMLEPPGLSRSDGKRPDGLTLVPWEKGKCLLWDATCVSTFAASHLSRTMRSAGAAAEHAASLKKDKYSALSGYLFVPLAVETSGCWCAEGKSFLRDLGRRLLERGLDPRSGFFLMQRLSIAIQRGNAASVMGTFASGTAR
ncbi:uncharacterized protein LOC133525602 [Cydia pomonella]|uniref:uncharacterized protein LOC133517211 n=1 Tax=Cydia pomonella TaxID=82600 RepID=UPI002ADD479A|nr:uncharacterized protein LOC133517211 [Cydia pomonella]XP_061717899.1 uncharacterized protein LOC133525602 [Cydia pomonella]